MTETSTTLSMFPVTPKISAFGSGGQLLPGVRARVVKPDGTLANAGETGELVVQSPAMALGYFNDPEAYVWMNYVALD